jgi:diadenosine tetraphosphate (Ap4A) HIT family hydrolase
MMSADAPMRGYAWLPVRRHVIELHELTEPEGAAFMRDIRRVSRAIAAATGVVKLNYEIHGNTVPHLHLHLFPRYVDKGAVECSVRALSSGGFAAKRRVLDAREAS